MENSGLLHLMAGNVACGNRAAATPTPVPSPQGRETPPSSLEWNVETRAMQRRIRVPLPLWGGDRGGVFHSTANEGQGGPTPRQTVRPATMVRLTRPWRRAPSSRCFRARADGVADDPRLVEIDQRGSAGAGASVPPEATIEFRGRSRRASTSRISGTSPLWCRRSATARRLQPDRADRGVQRRAGGGVDVLRIVRGDDQGRWCRRAAPRPWPAGPPRRAARRQAEEGAILPDVHLVQSRGC